MPFSAILVVLVAAFLIVVIRSERTQNRLFSAHRTDTIPKDTESGTSCASKATDERALWARRVITGAGVFGVTTLLVLDFRRNPSDLSDHTIWAVFIVVEIGLTLLARKGYGLAAKFLAALVGVGGWLLLATAVMIMLLESPETGLMLQVLWGATNLFAAGVIIGSERLEDFFWLRLFNRYGKPRWSETEAGTPGSPQTRTPLPPSTLRAVRRRVYSAFVLAAIATVWLLIAALAGTILVDAAASANKATQDISAHAERVVENSQEHGVVAGLTSAFVMGLVSAFGQSTIIGVTVVYAPLFAYMCWLFLPFLLTLLIALPASIIWSQPGRFLLLRPFNHDRASRQLRRVVQRELAPLGHVYTLADFEIRIPWYVRVPFVFAQVAFLSFRSPKIRHPVQLQKFLRTLNQRVMRNLNWYTSFSKLFAIGCVDDAWQACVSLLVPRMDAVILDLSEPSQNIIWELRLLQRLDMLDRTAVIFDEKERMEVEHVLSKNGCEVSQFRAFAAYTDEMVRQRGHLRAALVQA